MKGSDNLQINNLTTIFGDDFVCIDTNFLQDLFYERREFNDFSILLDLISRCNYKKNLTYESFSNMAYRYGKTDREIRLIIFKFRDNGFIEVYKSKLKGQIVIAPRKNEYIEFCGEEIYLDESNVIPTPANRTRCDSGYDNFRKKVLKRDCYKCQLCGANNNLEVHHKKPYASYPKLRTVISNGITLCNSCHKKVHRKKV